MKKILIVDDNPFSTFLLSECIEKRKYRIVDINETDNLSKIIEIEKPNLIILDLIMPRKSGFDVLKEIRNIPVIVLSSLDTEEAKNKAYRLGAKHFIGKPFNPKYLNEIVQEEMAYIN